MGEDPDQTPAYGIDCEPCFPAGFKPYTILASYAGIKRGSLWDEADDPPWNGIRLLTEDQACRWDSTGQGWPYCNFRSAPGGCSATVTLETPGSCFDGSNAVACGRAVSNKWTVYEGTAYYGGYAVMLPIFPSSDYSIQQIMSDLGILIESDSKYEFWPVEDTHVVVRLANILDRMNILVKRDLS